MNKASLEKQKVAFEQRFNELQEAKTKYVTEITTIDTECAELKGKYDLLNELIANIDNKEKK